MNDTSTPLPKNRSFKSADHKGPRRSTLDFIKGFARAYVVPPSNPLGLPGVILN